MIMFIDFCHISVLFLILVILSVKAEKNVPVLIWETSSTNSRKVLPPALAKLSTSDFLRIFDEKLLSYHNPPLVLVFAEEKLSVEDFGWKDNLGHGSFPQLEALTTRSASTTFFPSVSKAIKGLKYALCQRGFKIQTLDLNEISGSKLDHSCDLESVKRTDPTKTVENFEESEESFSPLNQDTDGLINQSLDVDTEQVINIGNVSKSVMKLVKAEESDSEIPKLKAYVFPLSAANTGESRPSLLRRHDGEIARAFKTHLSTQSDIIGVYTAFTAALCFTENKLRHRRQDPDPDPAPAPSPAPDPGKPQPSQKVWGDATSTILIYFHNTLPVFEYPEIKVKSEVNAGSMTSDKTPQFLRLLVNGTVGSTKVNLGLCFSVTTSFWELAKVETKDAKGLEIDLLPTEEVVVARGKSYTCRGDVVFTDGTIWFVMADFQMEAYMSSPQFSSAQDCVSYFSIGIWSGIIVMFIMVVVLGWAITMIMNIKINDKMDDRFGKTINVGAG